MVLHGLVPQPTLSTFNGIAWYCQASEEDCHCTVVQWYCMVLPGYCLVLNGLVLYVCNCMVLYGIAKEVKKIVAAQETPAWITWDTSNCTQMHQDNDHPHLFFFLFKLIYFHFYKYYSPKKKVTYNCTNIATHQIIFVPFNF